MCHAYEGERNWVIYLEEKERIKSYEADGKRDALNKTEKKIPCPNTEYSVWKEYNDAYLKGYAEGSK